MENPFRDPTAVFNIAAKGLVISDGEDSGQLIIIFAWTKIYPTMRPLEFWVPFFDYIAMAQTRHIAASTLSPAFLEACKSTMEDLYCVILGRFRERSFPSRPLQVWRTLAATFNITETGLEAKWKRNKECCNPHCTHGAEQKKIRTCGGCKLVFYCGKQCQRKWVFADSSLAVLRWWCVGIGEIIDNIVFSCLRAEDWGRMMFDSILIIVLVLPLAIPPLLAYAYACADQAIQGKFERKGSE